MTPKERRAPPSSALIGTALSADDPRFRFLDCCKFARTRAAGMEKPGRPASFTEADLRRAALTEKDAARYRWLRSRDLETVYEGGVFVGKTPDNVVLNFEDCDRAVDAAMMAEKDTEE